MGAAAFGYAAFVNHCQAVIIDPTALLALLGIGALVMLTTSALTLVTSITEVTNDFEARVAEVTVLAFALGAASAHFAV